MILLTATNGGFHLDGLADTFDALSVKTSGDITKDRQKRLAVMKESTVGAIGVVAIVLIVLLKYLLVEVVLVRTPSEAPYILLLLPVFSKWVMVPALYHGRSAKNEGLAAIFIGNLRLRTLVLASASLFAVFCIATAAFSRLHPLTDPVFSFSFLLAASYGLSVLWARFCGQRFGGLTGDNLGALSEMAEPLFLAILFLWL